MASANGDFLDFNGKVVLITGAAIGIGRAVAVGFANRGLGDHGYLNIRKSSGRHAATTIVRRLGGDTTERPFRYRDRGTMATLSRFQAIAAFGRIRLSGFFGWLIWLAVHLYALSGFKNRTAVLANWMIAFLGRGRPQRAIATQQVFAREAFAAQVAGTVSKGGM